MAFGLCLPLDFLLTTEPAEVIFEPDCLCHGREDGLTDNVATMASAYAQYKLETEEGDIQAARRRIKVNLDVKPDEAIDLIQRMLECACGLDGSILCGTVACAGCTFSPLCLEYWKYQYEHG